MAYSNVAWYINYGNGSSTGYYATTAWAALTLKSAGALIRPLTAPAVGSERIYVATTGGTTGASEPTWTFTRGAVQPTDGTVVWQECTGQEGVNGDLTNCPTWTTVQNTIVSIGQVIQRNSGTSLQICSTAGTAGNGAEPSFSDTAGTTTVDNTITWTSLGVSSNFTAFLAPHARAANAFATNWGVAGNKYAIASIHAETQASGITFSPLSSGATTSASVYCILNTTTLASPTLSTLATITTTGANGINIGASSSNTATLYVYGVNFNCGTGSSAASINYAPNSNTVNYYENCSFNLITTSGSSVFNSSNQSPYINMKNCSITFGDIGQKFGVSSGIIDMIGGSIAATGTVPTNIFGGSQTGQSNNLTVRDMNLSAVTTNIGGIGNGVMYITNCKLGSGVSLPTSSFAGGSHVKIHNCDSASTNYRYWFAFGYGTVQQETTVVRAGSLATDGTTPISWNITSNANSIYTAPFVSEEVAQWSDFTSGSHTATFYLITNTTLNNKDFWAEVESLGTSSFPLGINTNSRMTPLGTPVALTSDSSSWGGAITNKYQIVITYTAVNKGPVKARFYLAKPSVTIYVDPYIYIV